MYLTLFLVIITSIVSFLAFSNLEMFNKLKFNAYLVWHKKEYSRILTHALVHSGWMHLIFNMYVLWMFGEMIEPVFSSQDYFPHTYKIGKFMYILMYILAVIVSSIPSLIKQKNNHYYNSVGASGAVSAIVFTTILLAPTMPLGIIFIPIRLPAYIFGLLYLAYTFYMSKQNKDNIAHEAHFAGSVFGLLFPILLNPNLIQNFIYQISQ